MCPGLLRRVHRSAVLFVFAVIAGTVSACDSADLQEDFRREAEGLPEGITRTDAGGRIITDALGEPVEVDSTDWRTAPAYTGRVRFDPAYPNPTRGELVTIPFVVPFSNGLPGGLLLRGFSNTGRFVLLDDVPDASQTGSWSFVFSPAMLSASGDVSSIVGMHRLFVFDFRGELVSYGDLRIR